MRIREILSENDYRGQHRAPGPDYGAPLHDLTRIYPDDIYSNRAAQYYGHFGGNNPMDVATVRKLHLARNKPSQNISIYRAVPTGVKTINPGDWVTINRDYAVDHGEGQLQGKYTILHKIVSAKDLYTDGNSIHEFGYYPGAVTEGGWASTLTQGTRITPALVKQMVSVYQNFINQFNRFLAQKDIPQVQAGIPAGSSFYYKQDLVDNPEKEYGDIDIEFIIPRIEGMPESRNESMYASLVKEFVDSTPGISTANGVNVIFELGKDAVQIDLVSVFGHNVHWSRALTPERGIKGAVSVSLYSSLAELLNLSISSRGVQIKLRGGRPVGFRQSKDVELKTVSLNPDRWAIDILNFFYQLQGGRSKPAVTRSLAQNPGVDVENIRIADIANAIKGLGESFAANQMFGQPGLETIQNYQEYINRIRQIFTDKMEAKLVDPKFAKADTPAAQAKADTDRKKLAAGMKLVLDLL